MLYPSDHPSHWLHVTLQEVGSLLLLPAYSRDGEHLQQQVCMGSCTFHFRPLISEYDLTIPLIIAELNPKCSISFKPEMVQPMGVVTRSISVSGWLSGKPLFLQSMEKKKIRGYVEWHEEKKIQIPQWCPIKI